MTNLDIFATVVSEAVGETFAAVRQNMENLIRISGSAGKFYDDVPDAEAEKLLTELRAERSGILKWYVDGIRDQVFRDRNIH